MSNTNPTPTPSALPIEIVTAATAAGTIAQTILAASGNTTEEAIAAALPGLESLLITAIQGFTFGQGAVITLTQWQELAAKADVPLVPPTA